jgi:hypothetical protein
MDDKQFFMEDGPLDSNNGKLSGTSGTSEPQWGDTFTKDGNLVWLYLDGKAPEPKPYKYYPDGKPILSDELMPSEIKWALLFENRSKKDQTIVGQTRTLYGEKLSTIWMGIDHNFSRTGPPLIFETMLFAPSDREVQRQYLREYAAGNLSAEKEAAYEKLKAHTAKHYPHDQLQLRYSTYAEAEDAHERLMLQCLIPPRWRHFILGTIYGDPTWLHYDEEVTEWWT